MSATLRRAVRRATADKKKLGIMAVLVAVGLGMWVRLLLQAPPGKAAADSLLAPKNGITGLVPTPPPPTRPTVYLDLPDPPERDPFTVDAKVFPQAVAALPTAPGVGKSPTHQADDEQRAEAMRRAASALKLQTTMLGDAPRAMINGQVLAIGDKIAGFTLTRVLQRQVVLEMDGVQVLLDM